MNVTKMLTKKAKWLKAGWTVVVSNADLDVLEATALGKWIRTVPNPKRCGTLDLWEASAPGYAAAKKEA